MSIKTDLNNIETLVRNGVYPDSPSVLSYYFDIAESMVSSQLIPQQKWFIFVRVSQTLLDVIYDQRVDIQWRELCVDNIYKPILQLKRLSKTEQEWAELRSIQYQLSNSARQFHAQELCHKHSSFAS
ncbi:hypothetical protein RS130_08260 [Paraglaciecola aquimarina]|uniref:Uncharacterized protein n=1 Tax=Paraglaciecola aquimarina TaxID=1235557 RepID=A0ABU3SVA1_9ALTE|nr:hypothetical protein [Paraglaciecola aquimarina]MDU0353921.1 hypothetical protein [Paraglaciecola aquimarina]